MTEPHIVVEHLTKTYRVPEREGGLVASLQSLWKRTYRNIEAVRDINFSIEEVNRHFQSSQHYSWLDVCNHACTARCVSHA